MKVYLKYNIEKTCKIILQEQLNKLGIKYTIISAGCVTFNDVVPTKTYEELRSSLTKYNIEIIDNNKTMLVQKVKDSITQVLASNKLPLVKMSSYLESKIPVSYRTMAKVFAEICHMPIEEYIILYKIEKVKTMLVTERLTLTEIAHTLQYSSVAHLSNQFKKHTGLCPKDFQEIMQHKRRNYTEKQVTPRSLNVAI